MREILFRGKSNWDDGKVKKGDWLYSMTISRHCYNDEEITSYYIGSGNKTIDGKTLGQYTGLTDKNGKKIFEGDIIRYTRTDMYAPSCSFHKQNLVSIHLVLWDSSVSAFVQQHYSLNEKRIVGKGSAVLYDDRAKENIVEVIGNIHDNPELLKSEVDAI